jgi:hypothetical protein
MPQMKLPFMPGLVLSAAVALLSGASPAGSEENPNEGGALLRQCEAMLSGTAEAEARMTCENTIWSTLRAIEGVEKETPGMKSVYCAPAAISIAEGARLYVRYLNATPSALHMPAEHVLILSLKSAYPCPS